MSEYGTSSPHFVQTRLNLMRPPSSRWTWWNETSPCSVAEYSFTGIVTSPNEIAPFQMLRMRCPYPPACRVTCQGRANATTRMYAQVGAVSNCPGGERAVHARSTDGRGTVSEG